jgi:hypothetical protein
MRVALEKVKTHQRSLAPTILYWAIRKQQQLKSSQVTTQRNQSGSLDPSCAVRKRVHAEVGYLWWTEVMVTKNSTVEGVRLFLGMYVPSGAPSGPRASRVERWTRRWECERRACRMSRTWHLRRFGSVPNDRILEYTYLFHYSFEAFSRTQAGNV